MLAAVIAGLGLLIWGVATAAPPFTISVDAYYQHRYFSPNGDGQEDDLSVPYCLSEPANVDVAITDQGGTTVRTVESGVSHTGTCGYPNYFTWDGKSDTGTALPDGLYIGLIHAINASGQTAEATLQIGIDTHKPGQLTAPAPGDTLSGQVAWTFTPSAGSSLDMVQAYCDGTNLGSSTTANQDGSFSGSGDTTGCVAGANNVVASVWWTDAFQNGHNWTAVPVPVTINNPPSVSIEPYYRRAFSPNGDGQEDSATVVYCLSKNATIDVTVTNADNTTIRTIESKAAKLGGKYCSSPGYNVAAWDGADDSGRVVPDGVYTLHVDAVDASGQTGSATVQLGVDARTPGALTAPAPGATLSNEVTWTFTPTTGFGLSRVDIGCTGAYLGYSTTNPDGTFSATADLTRCYGGANSLTAWTSWTDAFGAGHYWTANQVPVIIDNPPQVTIYDQYRRYFSPNGDGQEDVGYIAYCLSKDAKVDVTVTDSANATVRTIESAVDRPGLTNCIHYNSAAWDGTDDAGRVVPGGVFTVHVHAVDATGQTADDAIELGVDTGKPGALTAPAAEATLSGQLTWTFTPTTGYAFSQVDIACTGAHLGFSTTANPDGTFSGTADSAPCYAGANIITASVYWTDAFGSGHYWSTQTPVSINNAPQATFNQYYQHRYFSPNGDGQEDSASITYCLSKNAKVDVTVTNSTGATVRTIESGVDRTGQTNCGYYNATTWDGTDDAGRVVPDGVYTLHAHAVDATGLTGDGAIELGVDNRTPGTLTAPAAGGTLAGLARFAFQPTNGYPLTQIDAYFDTGGRASIYNASPDGLWRTSLYTGSLRSGPAVLHTYVAYADPFGASHSWTAPDTPVVIDVTSLPLTVTADPASGPAPLSTTLHIDTSDPQARPVHYTVNFGDDTAAASGDITDPYRTLELPHAYLNHGAYRAVVTVTNDAGAASTRAVDITASGAANTAPTANLTLDSTSGVVPLPVTATILGSDAQGDPLTFSLDFGDGSPVVTGSLPRDQIVHTYSRAGTYLVRFAVSDGKLTAVKTATVVAALAEPLRADAGDDQVVAANTTVYLNGSASRPTAGIESYRWDFGDGSTGTGATTDHSYPTAGAYTVMLTVTAAGQSTQDTAQVVITPPPTESGLTIAVTDTGNNPVSEAELVVIDGAGQKYTAATDQAGSGHLHGLPDGSYTVYGWKSGYLPANTIATINHDTGTATLTLAPGEVATAQLTATPMTYDQIVAAGINPNDPANQNVYQFTGTLEINTSSTSFSGFAASGGFPRCPTVDGVPISCPESGVATFDTGGYHVSVATTSVHGQPQLIWLVIPAKASWLKEFFTVQMMVTNLANPAFTLDQGHATLPLPAGLALAPTAAPQHETIALPDIPGGTSQTATWLVRGDNEGFYDLTASYAGILEPFGDTITVNAASTTPLHVWGGSALQLTMDVDDTANDGYAYHAIVSLKNVADVPIYNATLQLLTEGKKNYIYQPREQLAISAAILAPGNALRHDYILVPTVTGLLDLSRSFISRTAGNTTVPTTISTHPAVPRDLAPAVTATNLQDKVGLTWAPVPGATDYEIFSTPDPTVDFPPTPAPDVETLRNDGDRLRAVVRNVPHGTEAWYAISPVVNGKPTMSHPLVTATSASTAPTPSVDVTMSWPSMSFHACKSKGGTIEISISEPFFDLVEYEIVGADSPMHETGLETREKTISHISLTDLNQDRRVVTLRTKNSDGEWDERVYWFDNKCERQTAIVVAMGLNSSLNANGSDNPTFVSSTCPDQPDGSDNFNKQAAANACDAQGDPVANLMAYLKSKGYDYGEDRSAGSRTVLEFSYNGADVPDCKTVAEPTFTPRPYSVPDTYAEIAKGLALNSTATAGRYVDMLKKYSECWETKKGKTLTFTVIGHSEGGYEALAIAAEAVKKDYPELISRVISVDGAIHPHVIIPELQIGECFVDNSFLKLPVDVAQAIATAPRHVEWLVLRASAYLADTQLAADRINAVTAKGIQVATVTNQLDGCLGVDATINDAATTTRIFSVDYGVSGIDRHGALLQAHHHPTSEPGYPLAAFLDEGWISHSGVLLPVNNSPAGITAKTRLSIAAADSGHIVGRLINPNTGQPITTGQIVVAGNNAFRYITVHNDGTFDVDALPPGRYRVFAGPLDGSARGAWAGGATYAQATEFTVQDNTIDVGDVSGTPMRGITITVATPDGHAVGDGVAVLVDQSGREVALARTKTDGTATLTAPPGSYQLAAASPSTAPASVSVDLTATSAAALTLQPAAAVTATARDEQGSPIPGVAAALYSGETVVAVGFTDTNGRYIFSGLSESAYTVRLYEALQRFELPAVALPVTPAIGNLVAGEVTYTQGRTPTITSSAPPATATVGVEFSHTFTAPGSPQPTFASTNGQLSPGLTLDPTGLLHGRPTAPGTYTFSVLASNSAGTTIAGPYSIVVDTPTSAPTTTQLRTSANPATYGQQITLTAVVDSPTATPGGTITFDTNGVAIHGCAAVPIDNTAGNTATCATNQFSAVASPHTITATYPGSGVFAPSQATLVQTVNPAVLTVDATDVTRGYGADSPSLSYQLHGFVNGDDPSIVIGTTTCRLDPHIPLTAGAHPNAISCDPGTLTATNYTVTTGRAASLTISKAPLTITADDSSTAYAANLPALTARVSGFVRGETLATSGVNGTAQCTTTATPQSAAGLYPITCTKGTLAAANYSFAEFRLGTLTVIKRAATLQYTGPQYVSTGSATATTAPSVPLQGQITASSGGAPDLTKATATFLLYRSSNTTTNPDRTCTATATTTGAITCTLTNVAADNWTVVLALPTTNNYYSSDNSDPAVLSVYQPITGKLAAGAGWATDPSYQNKPVAVSPTNNRGTFGFVVGYTNRGEPTGQAVYTFRGSDKYQYVITTSSWQGGGLSFAGNTVSFTAKCAVTVLNPATHSRVPGLGGQNYTCRVDATDNGVPGTRDTYALSVYTSSGSLYHQVGTPKTPLPVRGGDILVRTR